MTPDRLVLFDLDGTLTDSAPGILGSLRHALVAVGHPVPPEPELRPLLGPPLSDTFRGRFGMDEATAAAAIAAYRERYHAGGMYENAVYPGIPELLGRLASAGSVLAVATSKPTWSATRILEHFGLAPFFAHVAGAELDGSRETKTAVIAHSLARLGALGHRGRPFRMVGDREHDVLGARAHGIPATGVLWGYGDAAELAAAGASEIAATPAELAGVLLAD